MPFRPGDKKPAGSGRKKGQRDTKTLEIRAHARAFLENPLGQAKLREQYEAGELHPSLVQMLHHYAYGKPKDQVEVSGPNGGPLTLDVVRRLAEAADRDDPE